jgi:mannose-6-phosphate isomerase-like protein (cupin superfamily)
MNPKTITNPSPETSTEASTVVGPVVDAPMTGRAWWFLDTLVVEHPMATAASPVVLEQTLPAGAAPPLHVHRGLDDSWYLLEGVIVVQCGEHLLVATPGHWISAPRGVPHAFRVVGDRPARTLLVHNNPQLPRLRARPRRARPGEDAAAPDRGTRHRSPNPGVDRARLHRRRPIADRRTGPDRPAG